jgi:kynureninase
MAAHNASLDIFDEAGIDGLHEKRKKLTRFAHFILNDINNRLQKKVIEIITPPNENEHGCQVSMFMLENGKTIFNTLKQKNIFVDWREPNVIRIAPVPLYNTFEDIWRFGNCIETLLQD